MKKQIEVGDEHTVDFMKNANGGRPVCRIEGIVAFINKDVKSFVVPCTTWMVKVVSIYEKHLIVEPLVKVRSSKENDVIMTEKLNGIRTNTNSSKRVKPKNFYPYKSFSELKQQ